MNLEKVVFGFFVLLAATLNFGFFIGDLYDSKVHNVYELFAAVVINLVVTAMNLGDRTHIGAFHLVTSLVDDVQLIAATIWWALAAHISSAGSRAKRPRSSREIGGDATAVRESGARQRSTNRFVRKASKSATVSGRAKW